MNTLVCCIQSIALLLALCLCAACNVARLPESPVSGELLFAVDDYAVFQKAPDGVAIQREFVFDDADDKAEFRIGEYVKVTLDEIDFGNYTFVAYITPQSTGSDRVSLCLSRTVGQAVYLNSTCQTIHWYNPYYIPTVSVKSSLPPEQIVITPLLSSNNVRVGYEIRYGSLDMARVKPYCEERSKKIYDRFKPVAPREKTPTKKSSKSKPKESKPKARDSNKPDNNKRDEKKELLVPRNMEELRKRLFGI